MISVNRLDWKRISKLYVSSSSAPRTLFFFVDIPLLICFGQVKTRTPTQCIIQWTTQEHPTINKKPWTNAESKRLMELVDEYSIYGKWEAIARDHKSNRTASQCFSHYQALQNIKISKKKWTPEEDEALKEAVSLLGERNWQQVAAMFAQRTGNQCLQRWTKSINPAIRREKWNKEEDEILRRAVEAYGVGNWTRIQKHLPGRTDMQVRERYMNVLDPSLNITPATEEEEDRLWELVGKYGRKWSMLTQFFPGRTDNRLLRMYKAAERRRRKKATDVNNEANR
ncbi:Homeodomain-like protein [Dichotomocladium elegans]|nr:Homeodomain-like protein [Dichotomocladium elegans]